MSTRMVDAAGTSVEPTPHGFVVRAPNGIVIGQHYGVEAPLPHTPAELIAFGVDLASLTEWGGVQC